MKVVLDNGVEIAVGSIVKGIDWETAAGVVTGIQLELDNGDNDPLMAEETVLLCRAEDRLDNPK